jgi:hypothetical protein
MVVMTETAVASVKVLLVVVLMVKVAEHLRRVGARPVAAVYVLYIYKCVGPMKVGAFV